MDTVTADEDEVEFDSWARPSIPAMRRLARRLAPDADPEDVVQESLTRAWQQFGSFDPTRGTPTSWMLAIVADRARSARRSRIRRLRLVDDHARLPEIPLSAASPDIDLERAITSLTERQQLAVHLHYFLGLTVGDAADVMACSAGTVKSTLFDARARLRALLGDDNA